MGLNTNLLMDKYAQDISEFIVLAQSQLEAKTLSLYVHTLLVRIIGI